MDEEFVLHEQWKNSIFVNPNHSFVFILSKNNKIDEEYDEYLKNIFDKFGNYYKSNDLKVELFNMNYNELNEGIIYN